MKTRLTTKNCRLRVGYVQNSLVSFSCSGVVWTNTKFWWPFRCDFVVVSFKRYLSNKSIHIRETHVTISGPASSTSLNVVFHFCWAYINFELVLFQLIFISFQDNIPDSNIQKIQPYIDNEDFTPAAIAKVKLQLFLLLLSFHVRATG